jgi:hypothetical protein
MQHDHARATLLGQGAGEWKEPLDVHKIGCEQDGTQGNMGIHGCLYTSKLYAARMRPARTLVTCRKTASIVCHMQQ